MHAWEFFINFFSQRFEHLYMVKQLIVRKNFPIYPYSFPEIYEMQVRAIVEAAAEVKRDRGFAVQPKIMIPLVSHERELSLLRQVVENAIERVLSGYSGVELEVAIGTMIELPRACITADAIAEPCVTPNLPSGTEAGWC